MGCCDNGKYATDEEKYSVVPNTPCGAISIDLLNMYLRPITCYLQYRLWTSIGSTEMELVNAKIYLLGFIDQKKADPENCEGMESLAIIRVIVDKIIKKGVCL